MAREIRHRDGSVQHVYAGPNGRPWWQRHRGGLACTALLAVAFLLAHYGAR